MRSNKNRKNKIEDEWKTAEAQLKSWTLSNTSQNQINWAGNTNQNLNWTPHNQQWGQVQGTTFPNWGINPPVANWNYTIQNLDYTINKSINPSVLSRLFVSTGDGAFFPCPLTA